MFFLPIIYIEKRSDLEYNIFNDNNSWACKTLAESKSKSFFLRHSHLVSIGAAELRLEGTKLCCREGEGGCFLA